MTRVSRKIMGKKKPRRIKLAKPSPEAVAARASGLVINENRRGTLIRLIDTSIRLWFFESDPFSTHLLACAAYLCLCDLGKNNGKGPVIEQQMGRFKITAAYDFMRHAVPDMLDDEVDLSLVVNEWLLFDGISSFARLFGGTTAFMRTFMAYYAIWPSPPHEKLRENAATFFPEGVSVEDVEKLSRLQFFAKFTKVFAAEILRQGGSV